MIDNDDAEATALKIKGKLKKRFSVFSLPSRMLSAHVCLVDQVYWGASKTARLLPLPFLPKEVVNPDYK
jgi:hypothetical protein